MWEVRPNSKTILCYTAQVLFFIKRWSPYLYYHIITKFSRRSIMISANEINALLEDYLKSSDGQDFLKKQGVSINFYDEEQLRQIAEHLKNDIINEFLRITNHASLIDAQDYFGGAHVKVGKVSHTKNGDKVNINFSDHALYRPSLVGRNGKPTGEGINDIFALITNGTNKQSRVYGYWTYYSEGMGYGAEETWTRAWLPRRGKPFIEAIIRHYEAANPGLKITYPPNWR